MRRAFRAAALLGHSIDGSARDTHQLRPFRLLGGDESGEFLGCAAHRVRALLAKTRPHVRAADDGCDLRDREKRSANVKVIADYNCPWNESKNAAECAQHGLVNPEIRTVLVRELRQLGVPAKAPGDMYFTVWESDRVGWSLAQAYYSNRIGSDIELCEVIAVVDQNAHVTVLRKLPLKKTDVDVPDVTDWTLLDLADTRGNGQTDVILVGDAYEDHWLEVISVQNGSAKTIFSGLGYYL